jgi:asparagine synthase (glutamine-hydrolysing)
MGAHAGTFFFDGRPARCACRALRSGLEPIAPDGVSVHAEDGVAMAHGAFHVWAGESHWPQPHQSSSGLVATWDGRLDHRDDLLLRLGQPLGDDVSDVGLALTVFERWGIEGLRFLIGDWSLAIWDPHRRTLHLARDYMGVRPLYYYATDQYAMWSSSLAELAQRTGRVDALSEEFVAGFMTQQFSSGVTPYVNVRAVRAAACVSFTQAGSEASRQFWALQPARIRFGDKREYEVRLRALWAEAVGARLRIEGTAWAELSGGLDSSSVVCMADALIKDGRVRARRAQPISHATLESPDGDERRFIGEVESQIGLRSEILGIEDHCDCTDDEWGWVTPFAISGVGMAIVRRIHERGGRLVLSGRVGDAIMGCDPDNSLAVLDDFADGHLLTALTKMRQWSRASKKPLVEICRRLAQRSTLSGVAAAINQRTSKAVGEGQDLLSSRLRSLTHCDDDVLACAVSNARASNRDTAAMVLAYAVGSHLNVPQTPPSIVYTYPFAHRPLVEFMLAIPGEELSAPGQNRSLMRRAFDGLVPARILRRTSKGHYPPSTMRSLRPVAASMLPVDCLESVRRGWLNARQLDAALRLLLDGRGSIASVRQAIRLEQWLSSRDRRAPAVIPQGKEVNSHAVFNT